MQSTLQPHFRFWFVCFFGRSGLTKLFRLTLNSLHVAQAGLELVFFCLRPLGIWDYGPVPPGLAPFLCLGRFRVPMPSSTLGIFPALALICLKTSISTK